MAAVRTISVTAARRLAISAQQLAGDSLPATRAGILETVTRLGRLQLDPTRTVERTHQLVLWSRLGPFDRDDLRRLLEEDRSLFEYSAFIIPTDDFPLFRARMRAFPAGDSKRARDYREWMRANDALRRSILAQLRRRGPQQLRDFEDRAVVGWASSGWTDDRNVSQMLECLWKQGKVLVTRRAGGQRVWDLAERVLPTNVLAKPAVPERVVERLHVEREVRRRGLATAREIPWPPASRRPAEILDALTRRGALVPLAVDGVPGDWRMHVDDLELLERIEAGEWSPRTTLLSPFDTLIYDRDRTEALFGFRFRLEIYVPKAKREYGFFVLPLLQGDRLVGRVDPEVDRRAGVLRVKAVHWERRAPKAARQGLERALAELAGFVGADRIDYTRAASTSISSL